MRDSPLTVTPYARRPLEEIAAEMFLSGRTLRTGDYLELIPQRMPSKTK